MIDYLEIISSSNLTRFVNRADEVFPKFTTINESYKDQLNRVKDLVANYFADATLQRPLSYLILGPAGAGKSYFMKRLVDQLGLDQKNRLPRRRSRNTPTSFAYQSVNLSEVVNPVELHQLYKQITLNWKKKKAWTITLVDEVDVRWGSGSAIKHLINPMYDAKYWDGQKLVKFERCAFFFAGSYLQDRETLLKTQRIMAGLDMNTFLLDTYLEMLKRNNLDARREIQEAQEFCYAQQLWRADADPDTDTILYLRNLEKIRDFLSRIAGNFFEMIDVSAPLNVTHEAFRIHKRRVTPTSRLKPIEVTRFIKRSETSGAGKFERYRDFSSPSEPLLEYKNVLLAERLLRVIGTIEQRFRQSWPANVKTFKIRRTLLNLLTVAPLINGMRSLEQLVNLLDKPGANPQVVKRSSPFKLEEISMIIHDAEDFSDPGQVWVKMKSENPALRKWLDKHKTTDDDLVTVPTKP